MLLLEETRERALDMSVTAPGASAPGANDGSPGYTPPADFAVATAISTDKPITNPRRVRTLRVTVAGVPDRKQILSDARQKEELLPTADPAAGATVRVEIRVAPFDAAQAEKLPVKNPELAPYLQKGAYLDTEDAALRDTAARLRGGETNLYRVATTIRNWVHQQMTPDASIGVPRSATDILARRRGVCRDYATLYTALARAAGVPTRLCSGIVYGDGKFFYHAWAESWVGQWVAFDPTLYAPQQGADFVDATHIKFAQGDVTGMFDVVSIVGKLRITVQDFAM
jgi:transglutaminase-like putative cysteine protease